MNRIKKTAVSTKKFVYKHRVALAITITAITVARLDHKAIVAHDNFLKEHNLYEQFYLPE